MKKLFLICLFLGIALSGFSQDADQTVYSYKVQYAPEHNVHLFYRDGKLMLKISDPHLSKRHDIRLVRKMNADGTVEPMPDTLRERAVFFIDRDVFVDDTVAVRVKEMIKTMKLSRMKEKYERVYKKDELVELGGSSWNLMFLKPDGSYGQSGGRFLLNRKKAQKNLDKYMARLRTINDFLLGVDVKYCPIPKDYQ
ncbi:MAG: hypothetical protein IJK74_07265 [Bacteroidales bacterium]|nr:hypothetical protein [Bacteroidales bacterium]